MISIASLTLLLFMCVSTANTDTSKMCRLKNFTPDGDPNPLPKADNKAYNKLKPLLGKKYSMKDTENDFSYTVGICTPAIDDDKFNNVGVVQHELHGAFRNLKIGLFTSAQFMSGKDWILIEYWDGDKYNNHCGGESKKAVILIVCDENADDENPGMLILEEARNKTSDCYYLFELSHKAVCGIKTSTSISFGSILLIIFSSAVALYLLLGFLYQRFVNGAKGMQQIPNYAFWQDFGNLQADGCNLVCRSKSGGGSQGYKGIGDEQLEEDIDRDDHLLPM